MHTVIISTYSYTYIHTCVYTYTYIYDGENSVSIYFSLCSSSSFASLDSGISRSAGGPRGQPRVVSSFLSIEGWDYRIPLRVYSGCHIEVNTLFAYQKNPVNCVRM